MAYCDAAQVRAIVDSDVTDPEIIDLITEVQALMISMLDVGSINALILQGICRRWTAYNVMQKDPNSRGLGEYSENRTQTMKMLWEQILFWMDKSSGGIAIVPAREELG